MGNLHTRAEKAYSIAALCRLLGVSKQAYFKYNENYILQKAAQEAFAVEYIHTIREQDRGIGGKKLWYMYKRDFQGNAPLGRDKFADIIDRNGLKVRNKVRKPKTTDSTHGLPTFPNLIKDYIPLSPNRLWVADITYIPVWITETCYAFSYASFIMDAYTKEVIGWSIGPSLETIYPLKALRMALQRLDGKDRSSIKLIHHSDRGVQYASKEYIQLLQSNGIQISMTESGDPKDNAQAERINNTVKNELLKDTKFYSIAELINAMSKALYFYNNKRPHMSLDMMTPAQVANCTGEIKKRWVSYRENAIKEKRLSCEIPDNSLPLGVVVGSPVGLRPPVNPTTG